MNTFIIILLLVGLSTLLLGFITAPLIEMKDFNDGICPNCGHKLYNFDTDSSGADGWTCENCDYTTWVSYKKFVYKYFNKNNK